MLFCMIKNEFRIAWTTIEQNMKLGELDQLIAHQRLLIGALAGFCGQYRYENVLYTHTYYQTVPEHKEDSGL